MVAVLNTITKIRQGDIATCIFLAIAVITLEAETGFPKVIEKASLDAFLLCQHVISRYGKSTKGEKQNIFIDPTVVQVSNQILYLVLYSCIFFPNYLF